MTENTPDSELDYEASVRSNNTRGRFTNKDKQQNTTRRNTPRSSVKKASPLASSSVKKASARATRHTKKTYRSQLSRGVTKHDNNREITWHLVGEFAKSMQGECDNDSCIPPYPDPDHQPGKWNWYLFIQSANYWGVDDEDLPGNILPHLLALTPKECSVLDHDLKRPKLSKFILKINHVSNVLYYDTCLSYGFIQFFKYSHEVLNIPWSDIISIGVASSGNLPLLIYVHENGCPWNESTCEYAAGYNQLPCLKYAHEQGCPWDAKTTDMAAGRGSLSCLKYAHEQGCPCPISVCVAAAASGHIDCLKYAHEHEVPWGEVVTDQAISNDQVECLKYAHTNGCPMSPDPCAQAAKDGAIHCLRYLHENRIPWDINTTGMAAQGGHLDCLQYAHEKGCPWDVRVTIEAIDYDNVDCMEYAYKNHLPFPGDPCGEAAEYGSINCLQFLHEHGAPWGDVIAKAIENDQIECLKYAHQQGCPLGVNFIDNIMEGLEDSTLDHTEGLFDCLKYAHRIHFQYDKGRMLHTIQDIINVRKSNDDVEETKNANFISTKILPYISTRM
jgi:hypothetical protein